VKKVSPSQITSATSNRTFVRFLSKFERLPVRGYILDSGPKFFIVSVVSDRFRFDGFECFRVDDVRDLLPDSHSELAEAALRIRGRKTPAKPHISLSSIEDLLLTASREFPLVTIHREQVDAAMCSIGRVQGIDKGRVSLLEISPDAKWDDKPEIYRLNQVTRVGFGGDYEDALYLVGGEPDLANKTVVATAASSMSLLLPEVVPPVRSCSFS
jgi:hypothetical protein